MVKITEEGTLLETRSRPIEMTFRLALLYLLRQQDEVSYA